jgi:ribulose-5-phosphate 4-epimerase/fuculose-1-phosphate aldolase
MKTISAPGPLADKSPEENQARIELAAAYRLFAALGWHELIYNHITVKVPGTECFLINPFGLMYREVKASNLVKVDIQGNILGSSDYGINPAGFIVHAAVHRARPDVGCVMHTHTTAGLAVACQADGLLPMSFPAMFYTERLAYHDFEGVTIEQEECGRLAADLGTRNAMILRNHGLLACGPSIADAFAELYHLQRACEVQIAVQSSGAKPTMPSREIGLKAAAQHDGLARAGVQNRLLWSAMLRWMDETNPDYRE